METFMLQFDSSFVRFPYSPWLPLCHAIQPTDRCGWTNKKGETVTHK